MYWNIKFRPRCPLPDGSSVAISGVYWAAGWREAPARPLISGLPGRRSLFTDASMLITQPGPGTEGGHPSAR